MLLRELLVHRRPALFHGDATLRCVSAKEETTCCPDPDVKIYSDGSCVWNREYQLSVTHCPLDITWFPFDKQDCNISYESLTQESQELSFTSEEDRPVRLDQYTPNGEWWLPGMTAQLHTYIHKSFIKTMTEHIDFTVKTKSKCSSSINQ